MKSQELKEFSFCIPFKKMTIFSKKCKIPYFWALFSQIWAKMNFPQKLGSVEGLKHRVHSLFELVCSHMYQALSYFKTHNKFLINSLSQVRASLSFPILLKFKEKLRVLLKKIFWMEKK